MHETMGARMRRLRNEAGLQQQTLAEQAQVPQSLLSMLEKGQRQGDTIAVGAAVRIAAALGCSVEYLVTGQERRPVRKRKPRTLASVGGG